MVLARSEDFVCRVLLADLEHRAGIRTGSEERPTQREQSIQRPATVTPDPGKTMEYGFSPWIARCAGRREFENRSKVIGTSTVSGRAVELASGAEDHSAFGRRSIGAALERVQDSFRPR